MIALWAALALAHPLSPASIQVQQGDPVVVTWQTPAQRPVGVDVRPVLPDCPTLGVDTAGDTERIRTTWTLDCPRFAGLVVGADGLESTDVLVEVSWADGGATRALLSGSDDRFTVPEAPSTWGISWDYLGLGVHHLLGGTDHLLLVLLLLLLVKQPRPLVHAVTAFTVGHSASLLLAASGVLSVVQAPVEVAIAGTLVWLAAEVGTERSRIGRHPWLVCLPVGLIHGLGFAGALAEAGLPDRAVPAALLAFNVGLEVAQLGVIGVVLTLDRWVPIRASKRLATVGSWAAGSVAAMWVIERTAGWLL